MHRRPYIGGNWKMNTDRASASNLTRGVVDGLRGLRGVDIAIFPPFPYLLTVGAILRERGSAIRMGAQDLYFEADGAFTGEVSLSMLRDCGVTEVLTGHSERRHVLGDDETIVHLKTQAVLAAGLTCILCVGEKLEEREEGRTDRVNEEQVRLGLRDVPPEQLERLIIAYEPVWAIGTGRTASPEDAQDAHLKIRRVVQDLYGREPAARLRIIYGGSVKASNARELFIQADIDGGLIGGASLKDSEYVAVVKAAADAAAHKSAG
jgi:triosephosphate isomerase (TIM)